MHSNAWFSTDIKHNFYNNKDLNKLVNQAKLLNGNVNFIIKEILVPHRI